jgi:hypothetical protein
MLDYFVINSYQEENTQSRAKQLRERKRKPDEIHIAA